MVPKYQVIIIGAGPAGLIAGHYLKNALILEQKKEIGESIHCVGVSKKALEVQRINPHPSWACSRIYKIERIMPNGKTIGRFHKRHIGFVVDKSSFEKFLSREIKGRIKFNTKVVDLEAKNNFWEITTHKGEQFRSKYIIGADGCNSIVREKVFIENKEKINFASGLEYLVKLEKKIDTRAIKIYLDNEEYTGGYAWIFPKSNNVANIGVGGEGDLNEKINRFLKDTMRKNYGDYQVLGVWHGTVSSKKEGFKLLKANAMLVGDAAGLVDPIFKAGTNQAMISGRTAAQLITKNKTLCYESEMKSMPFSSPKIFEASQILYSLNNQTLNELGEILEGKGFSYLKSLSGFIGVLSRTNLKKNIFKLLKFFSIWQKNQDWLW